MNEEMLSPTSKLRSTLELNTYIKEISDYNNTQRKLKKKSLLCYYKFECPSKSY
jgi:hypothetical protein